jgi:parallel beta-helix repeat protein
MKKCLVVGIIFLFVGTSISSTIALDTKQPLPASRGNWLYVGGDGPGNYTRIQDAIDNASDNDNIYVFDDASPYIESLIIDRKINLMGENKTSTIVRQTDLTSDTITILSNNITLQGFTIENNQSIWSGRCSIYGKDIKNVVISNNILSNGEYGIYISNGVETSDNHLIFENQFINCDTGILFSQSNNNQILNNSFFVHLCSINIHDSRNELIYYNEFRDGYYGIILEGVKDSIVRNNTFLEIEWGMHLLFMYHRNIPNNIYIENNIMNHGGLGMKLEGTSMVYIFNNSISQNSIRPFYLMHASNTWISHNNLELNAKTNFLITQSYNVEVTQNNILEPRPIARYLDLVPTRNHVVFRGNYWNNSGRIKVIRGTIGIFVNEDDIWPIIIIIPTIKFDLMPAKEPFDIPGMS